MEVCTRKQQLSFPDRKAFFFFFFFVVPVEDEEADNGGERENRGRGIYVIAFLSTLPQSRSQNSMTSEACKAGEIANRAMMDCILTKKNGETDGVVSIIEAPSDIYDTTLYFCLRRLMPQLHTKY